MDADDAEKKVEEVEEESEGDEVDEETRSFSVSPVPAACEDSVGSADSVTKVLDSENDEDEIEENDVIEVESPGASNSNKSTTNSATEVADIGEEADSESGCTRVEKDSKTVKKKAKKTKKKRKKKKKDMNKGDVFISAVPKKRSRTMPNKRKKIRKLLTEDQLQKETLQALREEEERQKRLGLFSKDEESRNDDNRISFELLNEDEFPDITCNLDNLMNDIAVDIGPLSTNGLDILPVHDSESTNGSGLTELKGADVKAALETSSVAVETASHPVESVTNFSSDAKKLEQLLHTKNEETSVTPNGHSDFGTMSLMANDAEVSAEHMSDANAVTLTQLPPPFSQPINLRTLPFSGEAPQTSATSLLSPTSVYTTVTPTAPNSVPQSDFQGLILDSPSTMVTPTGPSLTSIYPSLPLQYNEFKAPVGAFSKPVSGSSEVICISSESSDDEKVKKQQQKSSQKTAPIDTISISSGSESSSDDVIFTGTDDNEIAEEEVDVNNSGMHVDDSMNQQDMDGRVLVNKNRPPDEPEIYLSPRLGRAVKPHQIGGIRFMFDNIVESLEHYKKSNGFGCILAHSMGLGKTLQVISFIDVFLRYTDANTALCVVPVNTLLNWIGEFEMWLPATKDKSEDPEEGMTTPRAFKVRLLSDSHKTTEARAQVISSWKSEGGVLLMGYEMFRLLTNQKSRRRKKKKQKNAPLGGMLETIDLEEEDKMSELTAEIYENLVVPGPDLIVCDEGHRIKNSHASISQALKQIATRRRIVLTGYPLQNNLMEYWCMVDFVRPSFLGAKQEFSNMFERPISNGQCADSNESDIRLMRFRSHVLHSLLKGFVQRRSHLVLKNSLPPKEEYVLLIRLSQWQKKLYNSFIKRQKEQGSGSWCSSLNPIKAFSICCKIWNHPDVLYRAVIRKTLEEQQTNEQNGLLDMDLDLPESVMESILKKARRKREARAEKAAEAVPGSGGKLVQSVGLSPFGDERERGMNYDWAIDLLQEYTANKLEFSGKMLILMEIVHHSVMLGDKILVFSQSLTTLTLIEEFLAEMDVPNPPQGPQLQRKWRRNESYFRLDGNTNTSEREKMIQLFNDKGNNSVHLFLLSTRAGCLGINLVGANRVVVFDISWNPCHDAQAVCRVYRYGQTKKCVIYRLICDQSMEKKIYDRQISKQGMSDRVVDELNPIQSLERQDVTKLLVYDDEDLPSPDIDECIQEVNDDTLKHTCRVHGKWLTKKPFHHESLLMDCKGSKLTKAEKRAAQKGYEQEKRASNSCNYSRPSYANFYAAAGYPSKTTASKNGANSKSPSTVPTSKVMANERPLQSTPFPMRMSGTAGLGTDSGDSLIVAVLQRSGINVKKTIAAQDIPLPQSSAGPHSKPLVAAGEPFYMIHGAKGIYIGTTTGRIFALRPHAAEENKAPSPLIQGPGGQMVTSREQESQVIKTAFNAMIRRNAAARQPVRNQYVSQPLNGAGFPSSFGQPQNGGVSLAGMMAGQNFGMSQQSPIVNHQSPIMSHIVTQRDEVMGQQNFHPPQQNSVMPQENGSLQTSENSHSVTQQNGLVESTANGPSAPHGQLDLTQQNFLTRPQVMNYPPIAPQSFQPTAYGVPAYLGPGWMNHHHHNGSMYHGMSNGVLGDMTQQNGNMNQQLLASRTDDQPTLAAVNNPTVNGDDSMSSDILNQQNGLTQQFLTNLTEGNAGTDVNRKDLEMTHLDGIMTQQADVTMGTAEHIHNGHQVQHNWMLNQQNNSGLNMHLQSPSLLAGQQFD